MQKYKVEFDHDTSIGRLFCWEGWLRGKWKLLSSQSGFVSLQAAQIFFGSMIQTLARKGKIETAYYNRNGREDIEL